MTGFKSKKTAALDEEGMYLVHQTDHSEHILQMVAQPAQEQMDRLNAEMSAVVHPLVFSDFVPPQPAQERNFCPRCGKRTADLTVIHTCTPPQKSNAQE